MSTHLENFWKFNEGHEREVASVGPAVDGNPIHVQVVGDGSEPRQDLNLPVKSDVRQFKQWEIF